MKRSEHQSWSAPAASDALWALFVVVILLLSVVGFVTTLNCASPVGGACQCGCCCIAEAGPQPEYPESQSVLLSPSPFTEEELRAKGNP